MAFEIAEQTFFVLPGPDFKTQKWLPPKKKKIQNSSLSFNFPFYNPQGQGK